MDHERVPVLIVGAGYAGLSAAMMLAWRGVPVMLVERHLGTSVQPKAFGVGPRALELMRPVPGLERSLAEISEGIGDSMRIAIATSLADPSPNMIIHGQDDFAFLADATPVPQIGAPQSEVERILRTQAEVLGADLRFGTELLSLEQDAVSVTALIRSGRTETSVHADYLIAADGHRGAVREMAGIPAGGKGELYRMHSIMFDADLTDLVRDREVTLWYIQNDTMTGAVITGTGVGAHVVAVNDSPTLGELTPDRRVELIRSAIGVPDLDVRLIDSASFPIGHVLADTYRKGRVFLAGDCAHTMPPTGGQGGSTALQDGADLAWRLWLVITGQAGPDFLDSYDAERRPVGVLAADAQLANLGVRMPPEARIGYPEPIEDPVGALLGYRYHSAATLTEPGDDGSPLEDPRHPTGRPGSRAPHVELDWEGRPISTIDLFGSGFVLLADRHGQAWVDAGRALRNRLGVRLAPHLIGGELKDLRDTWRQRYGVGDGGAVLVRPDGFVAWRSTGTAPDPAATLERALRRILARP